MQKTISQIREHYPTYEQLIKETKKVLESPIIIDDKNGYWEIGSVNVSHLSLKAKMKLDIQNSKREEKYSIQLFCQEFSDVPIFRFDSAGPRHRNKGAGGIILEVIDTPHFHRFNNEGKEIAYQSEILKNPKECNAIICNMDFGISHFCFESNSFLNENSDVPVASRIQHALDIVGKPQINYNNINFEDEL